MTDAERIAELEAENVLLRKTVEFQERQLRAGIGSDEIRRLRAKLAEWEGGTRYINGGYYHGNKFIKPFLDMQDNIDAQ